MNGEKYWKAGHERRRNVSETKGKLEDELDALFRLPLTEFTAALKYTGRAAEAGRAW